MEVILEGNVLPRPLPSPLYLAFLRIQPRETMCTGPASSTGPKTSSLCRGHPAQVARVNRQWTTGSLSFILRCFFSQGLGEEVFWPGGLIKPQGGGRWAKRQRRLVCDHWWQAEVGWEKKEPASFVPSFHPPEVVGKSGRALGLGHAMYDLAQISI